MFTINNSEARILVADHTRLDLYAPVITGELADIDFLVMGFNLRADKNTLSGTRDRDV